MASALEQFVNNVRQLSAQGRATKLISEVVIARQLAYAIYCLADSKSSQTGQSPLFALSCTHTA